MENYQFEKAVEYHKNLLALKNIKQFLDETIPDDFCLSDKSQHIDFEGAPADLSYEIHKAISEIINKSIESIHDKIKQL